MERKALSGITLTLFLTGMLTLAFDVQSAITSLSVHNVDTGLSYATIQEAIDAPETLDGHTIFVEAGTYYEHTVVNKSLSLVGEDRETTVIDGNRKGNVVHVKADNVSISGFTIRHGANTILVENSYNSSISGNNIENWVEVVDFTVYFYGVGIYLLSSSNCLVSENNISLSSAAVYLSGSTDCSISGNNVIGSYYGILMGDASSYNLLSNNTVKYNTIGILLDGRSSDSSVLGNHVEDNQYGILLGDWLRVLPQSPPWNTVLRNNNMTGNGYNFGIVDLLLRPSSALIFQDIDASNTVDGKPIYYWINQRDKVVPADAGYVAIINSTNITVENLTLTKNFQGALLAYTTNSTIKNVTATRNYRGIQISESSGCNISGNNVNHNRQGIILGFSSNCSITRNNIERNWRYLDDILWGAGIWLFSSGNVIHHNNFISNENGIWLSGFDNVIHHNNFIKNEKHVAEALFVNSWDDGYPSGGNYWSNYKGADWYKGPYQNETGSDGLGDSPYVVNAYNIDKYPLMKLYPWDPYDIGITRVESKTAIGLGFTLHVNMTVFNYGTFDETFNATFYVNKIFIAEFTDIHLASRDFTILSFSWNTTGIAKSSYDVTINATPVPDEEDITDNTLIYKVVVAMVGDVTGPDGSPDGKVDTRDIAAVAILFGVNYPDAKYDANYDIIYDGKIDIRDIATAAIHFGEIDP